MPNTTALTTFHSLYNRILSKFPCDNVVFSFAYGSGVLKQTNNEHKKNMLDFILVVDNAEKWHECNLKMNPSHYSFLSFFGSRAVAKVQTNIPSKVYFNSMIPIKDENVVIKYGVITQNDLIADLLDWNDLYVAGRLHKPVKVVRKTNSENILSALQLNLQSAVHASLLLLPENFSEIQFYKTVASLSYIGDFRMKFGEDKNKVGNIVSGGLQKFRSLYAPTLKMMEEYVEIPVGNGILNEDERSCRQDISPSAKHFHLNHLPRTPQRQLVRFWNKGSRNRQDTEDVLRAMAFDQDCGEVVQSILSGKEIIMSSKEDILDTRHESSLLDSQSSGCDSGFFGPALPPHLSRKTISSVNKEENTYGSSLLENLGETEKNELIHDVAPTSKGNAKTLIGPEIPTFLQFSQPSAEEEEKEETQDTDDNIFGPSTSLMATEQAANTYYSNNSLPKLNKQNFYDSSAKRETWMTELPEKKKTNFGLLPRHFSSRIHMDKESDDSVWTDTPEDKKKKEGHSKKKDHKEILKMKRLKERDKEMEKLAKKAAKSLRKKESLLEMHLKSLKKKKKKEKKREKEGKAIPERRPFDRNVDLQIRKFDEGQKRAILNKSQFLNDRFAAGQSRFL